MSVLKMLALSAAAGLALAASAQAQTARPLTGVTGPTAGPTRVTPNVRPTAVTPGRPVVVDGRPTVIDRRPERPDRRRGDDDSHLRRRLHNACFNSPEPPSPLCRRVFGDN